MIKKYAIANNKLVESSAEDSPIRIFVAPGEEEKRLLIDELRVDSHTLDSALDPDEPSRIEFEPDHLALIIKSPKNYSKEDQFAFRVSSIGCFLFKARLIIVVSEDRPLFNGKAFNSVETIHDAFLKMIFSSIHHYLEHLKVITMISNEIETKISKSMENWHLLNLFGLEKSLVFYLSALHSNGHVFERLKNNGAKLGFTQPELELLDDIIVENNQCCRQAEIHSNILASLMDARVSIVSNNLNILMNKLNLITIGIMMPTMVVSIFSMNVALPLKNDPYAFWIILGLALAAMLVFLAWWKRRKPSAG